MKLPSAIVILALVAGTGSPAGAQSAFPPGSNVELEAQGPGSVACVEIGNVRRCEYGSTGGTARHGMPRPRAPGKSTRELPGVDEALAEARRAGRRARAQADAAIAGAERQVRTIENCVDTAPAIHLGDCIAGGLDR